MMYGYVGVRDVGRTTFYSEQYFLYLTEKSQEETERQTTGEHTPLEKFFNYIIAHSKISQYIYSFNYG